MKTPAAAMGMGTATVQIQHAADRLGFSLGIIAGHALDAWTSPKTSEDRVHFRKRSNGIQRALKRAVGDGIDEFRAKERKVYF